MMKRTLLALSTLFLCATAMARPGGPYDIVSLGNGIYTVQWRDRPINTEPNNLIIVNDDDVVVVDSNLLPSTARAMVAEIRKITSKPVLAERGTVKTVLPDVLLTDTLILQRAARTIEIHYLGRGNTRGDVVVYLPKEKILATSDLVVAPTPFGFGSYYRDWIAPLDKLMQFDATTLVLAHGPIQHDYAYVKNERGLLEALVTRVADEVAKGSSLDDVKKNVTLADWREKLAGDDRLAGRGFEEFFVAPAVERAYHQAKGDPDDVQ